MKRSVKVDLSWRVWSLIVGFFILIGFVGFSIAFNSGASPSVMGHTFNEVQSYDSGWVYVDLNTMASLNLPHNLGYTPLNVQFWYSNNSNGNGNIVQVNGIEKPFHADGLGDVIWNGGDWTCDFSWGALAYANSTSLKILLSDNVPPYIGYSSYCTRVKTGYYRVIAY